MSLPDGGHNPLEADSTLTIAHALALDASDALSAFRSRFYIPSKADLKRTTLDKDPNESLSEECIYLCGNSLGLQPKSAPELISLYLTQWRTKAVLGHFVEHAGSPLAPWLHIDDHAARLMAPLVGAMESEIAVMGTLTSNLHLLMGSFYKPEKGGRYKILLEGKAFPSDHFAVQSQVEHHGFDADDALILLEPELESSALTTEQICKAIDTHADELALVLLPGVQFYSGQYFDIQKVTSHAHSKGILIGWDCAHAAGNVDLKLHDWDVDFAVWCSYKYLNAGPGAISGLFVHERHGLVDMTKPRGDQYRHRLAGWWGDDKSSRFQMTNQFAPIPGAAGYQVSNPSALDITSLIASLQIFNEATLPALRAKSVALTAYLEHLLRQPSAASTPYTIITPSVPSQRGAQLSIKLGPNLLETVLECLEEDGVVVDERKPDVVRVAPAPLFNSFVDVYQFVRIFRRAVEVAIERRDFGLGKTVATEMTIT